MGLTAEWIGALEHGRWQIRLLETADHVDPPELDERVVSRGVPGVGMLAVDGDWAYIVVADTGQVAARLVFDEEAAAAGWEHDPWPDDDRAAAPSRFVSWAARWAPGSVDEAGVRRRLLEPGCGEDGAFELLRLIGLELPMPHESPIPADFTGRRLFAATPDESSRPGVAMVAIEYAPDSFEMGDVLDTGKFVVLARVEGAHVEAARIAWRADWREIPAEAPFDRAKLAAWVLTELSGA